MKTITKRQYEAMFLVDSAKAASDWDGIIKAIETIFKRSDAEITSLRKWDERPLAYEIKGKERGTYILCYFKADGQKVSDIERDVQLSEDLMRVMVLNAEHMTTEDLEKATPAERAVKKESPAKPKEKVQEEVAATEVEALPVPVEELESLAEAEELPVEEKQEEPEPEPEIEQREEIAEPEQDEQA